MIKSDRVNEGGSFWTFVDQRQLAEDRPADDDCLPQGLRVKDRNVFRPLRVGLEQVGAVAERHRRISSKRHLIKHSLIKIILFISCNMKYLSTNIR